MAAVVTVTQSHNIAAGFTVYEGTIALDNAYPNPGGYALDIPANTAFDTLIPSPSKGYVFRADAPTQKLLVYRQKDPAAAGGADIPLPEVANGADLSALTTIPFVAYGA